MLTIAGNAPEHREKRLLVHRAQELLTTLFFLEIRDEFWIRGHEMPLTAGDRELKGCFQNLILETFFATEWDV